MNVYLVGITGGTCSGKSRFAKTLCDSLSKNQIEVCYINMDWYYKNLIHLKQEERDKKNFDVPEAIDSTLLNHHLKRLKSNQSVCAPDYDFVTHTRIDGANHYLEPKSIVIIEGIFLMADLYRQHLIDTVVYLDVPRYLRKDRRVRRDVEEYNRPYSSTLRYWDEIIVPMHEKYIKPTKINANYVLPNSNESDLRFSIRLLQGHLENVFLYSIHQHVV